MSKLDQLFEVPSSALQEGVPAHAVRMRLEGGNKAERRGQHGDEDHSELGVNATVLTSLQYGGHQEKQGRDQDYQALNDLLRSKQQ
jgi:hypothetical protein